VEKESPENSSDTGYRVKAGEMPLLRRACLLVMRQLGVEKDYTSKHLQSVAELFSLQTGAQVSLPKGIVAVRSYERILFKKSEVSGEELPCESFRFGEFTWGRYALTVSFSPTDGALRVDADKIEEGAVIRQRQEGDTFRKFGGGEKPLKKYLIDKKIPQGLRDGLPILALGSKVLAVFGVEIDEDVKVTDQTKKTAYLAVKEL
jgi:tRNA(Ile)-lysidine synthase